jgi:molybdenum cofactor cytidylyltransferase
VVVTGAGAQQVEETLLDARVRCVRNPHWRSGMGSSISAGVGALPGSVSALLVLLCDQYAVTVQDLQGLVEHWEHKPQLSIGSQVRDRIGPPAIFPRSRFAELSELRGDQGARALLNAEDQRTVTWHLAPAGIDLDTPDQLQRMKTGH